MTSQSVLVAMLNRLGGRTDSVAARRDLVSVSPSHLPLVEVEDRGADGVRVTALNVEELMSVSGGDEALALELLATLVREGATRGAALSGLGAAYWTTRDRRDLARQTLQWALDHPETGLESEAFTVARGVLDDASG